MSITRILFFDGTEVSALCWHNGHIDVDERFPATPVGVEALCTLLRAKDTGPVVFLADIAEEGFQLESIPHLQGSDRTALVTRRLGQYFYGTPYTTGMSLGRESSGRRDERVLFCALTRPDMFAPWFGPLRQARVPLRGLYSVPLVLAAQKFAFADVARYLIVTLSRGGLRQTFFDNGKMLFSRLSPLNGNRVDLLGATCARETSKTVQYLLGQRQISRGGNLPVYVLAHPDHQHVLRAQCPDTADMSYRFIDLCSLGKSLGYKSPLADSFSDLLLAHCLARHPPAHQFAPPPERHMFRLWQARSVLRAGALILAASGLAVAAKLLLDSSALGSRSAALRAATTADQSAYQAKLAALPKIPLSPADLRVLLARYDELQHRSPSIRRLLAHLGATLIEFPGVELLRLEWTAVAPPAAGKPVAPARTAARLAAPQTTPEALASTLGVVGKLPSAMQGDQRIQIETVARLAEQLRRDGVLVQVVTMPVDIQSDKPLRSDAPDTGGVGAQLQFALQLTLPLAGQDSVGSKP